MNVLEKILEEIKEQRNSYFRYSKSKIGKDSEKGISERITEIGYVEEIIHSHMDEIPNCEGCSRRKWYQKGYEDGKKDNDWIPVEERLPEEEGWYQCTCSDKEIWNDDIVRDLYYYPEIKEFVDNIRYEANGLKDIEKYYWTKYVTAWQFQPEPYKAKEKS